MPFLQNSDKQSPFDSKAFNLTKKYNKIPGCHIGVKKFSLKEYTDCPTKTTLKKDIPFLQLLQQNSDHLNFTETYDPNP